MYGVDPDWFFRNDCKSIQARLEQRHAGVKFLYVADFGRIFVLGGESGSDECRNDGENRGD